MMADNDNVDTKAGYRRLMELMIEARLDAEDLDDNVLKYLIDMAIQEIQNIQTPNLVLAEAANTFNENANPS